MHDPGLLCAGRRRQTPYAAKRLVQRRNCSDGPPLLPGWQGAPRTAAAVALIDPRVQNVVASVIVLSFAFLWARRLNRFLKEILT